MNVDLRPPRWRWLSRALYAFFALWLSVWLDRSVLAALVSGLVAAGALLAGTAPDLRSMREAAETTGTPLTDLHSGAQRPLVLLPPASGSAMPVDYRAREPAGGRLPLVVVDLDQTPLSRHLQRQLGASAALQLIDAGPEFGRGQDLLRQGRVLGLLLLPERLQETWLGASRAPARQRNSPLPDPPGSDGETPAPPAPSAAAEAAGAEVQIELHSAGGALGRQRALQAAIEQVMAALPTPRAVPHQTAALPAPQLSVAPGQLGVLVARTPAQLTQQAQATQAVELPVVTPPATREGASGGTRPAAAAPALDAGEQRVSGRTRIQLKLTHLDGGRAEAAALASASSPVLSTDAASTAAGHYSGTRGFGQGQSATAVHRQPPALLASPWLPALLALPAARPGTALLIVQQTLLVVLSMMFMHWTEQRAWPVRRNWSSYLGVWAGVTSLALLGCLGHLLPGYLAGWFDPAPGTRWDAMLVLLLAFAASLAALAIWLASLLRQREGGLIGLALLTLPLLTLAALPSPLQGSLPWAWPDSFGALLPAVAQTLSWLLPATAAGHGLSLLVDTGAGWPDLVRDFAMLGSIGAVAVAGGLYGWREPLLTPGL
jgi:hypothetical protein